MSLRRSRHGRRMTIVSLVLFALISLPLQAVSQDNGWQLRLVAEHEGGRLIRGGLGPDMTALMLRTLGGRASWNCTRSRSRVAGGA